MGDSRDSELSKRTRAFAITVIHLYKQLPKTTEAQILGKQVLRSGTSVGAHYSEANFAKSDKDFINKIEGALQELEETIYWLDLLNDTQMVASTELESIQRECRELIAIFVTIVKKVKRR